MKNKMSPSKRRIYDKGRHAAKKGKSPLECHYNGSKNICYWQRGYNAGINFKLRKQEEQYDN